MRDLIRKIVLRFNYMIKAKILHRDNSNVYISSSVNFIGKKRVKIESGSVIGDDSWFNVNKRELNKTRISIGRNSYIGKRNFFSSGKSINIGEYAMTGINCSFLGSDHKIDDPFKPYISTGVTDDAEINIGINVWLGANVTILGDVSIGNGCIIGANSLVLNNIPEYSIAVGNPAKVIKRYDFKTKAWVKPEFYEEGYAPDDKKYLAILESREIKVPKLAAGSSYSNLY